MSDFAWNPDPETIERAQLTKFLRFSSTGSFQELYERSIADPAWFTAELISFLGIQFDRGYSQILDLSRGPEWPVWCRDALLNISKSCLDKWTDNGAADATALTWEGEEGTNCTLSYQQLLDETERAAAGLRSCQIGRGDAVGIHLPMVPETVISLLALARIGAIAVPVFSGYGAGAIASRLRDVGARALITCDSFPRRGKLIQAKLTADEAVAGLADIKRVIVVRRGLNTVPMKSGRDIYWDQLLASGDLAPASFRGVESTGAEDTLIVIYSSGTTGKPKGIAHTHCGFPIKSAQDMCFGTDVGAGTVISWITDIGWMMGPWLIYGSLMLGGTIALYDGAPDFPDPGRLWKFAENHKVEVLGISPTLIRTLAAHGDEIQADLTTLRILGSTGEPWNPDPWWWLFEKVGKRRIPIINYSGGTEISGGILMGNPLLPIKPCSFSAPCPGIAADVVDDHGNSVRGAVGELVIRKPWIGQARGFWNDSERYLETYWSRFPGVWVHGDWAEIDEDGQWFILGRSDDTLKIAGKRVGPAELESILVENPAVIEAAVIAVPDEVKGNSMVAFCVLRGALEDDLAAVLKAAVAREMGKPLAPGKIIFVPALPKTRNGKIMRRVIRAAYLGEAPGDLTALENPAALEAISQLSSRKDGQNS